MVTARSARLRAAGIFLLALAVGLLVPFSALLCLALRLAPTMLASPQPRGFIRGIWLPSHVDRQPEVTSLAVSERHWFVGTRSAGVFWSWNRGRSWYPCNFDLPGLAIRDLFFDASAGELFAATDAGLAKTEVYNCFWSRVGDPKLRGGFDQVAGRTNAQGLQLVALSGQKLYASADHGRTWMELSRPGGPPFPDHPPGLQDRQAYGDPMPAPQYLSVDRNRAVVARGHEIWSQDAPGGGWRLLTTLLPASRHFRVRSIVQSPADSTRHVLISNGLTSSGSHVRQSRDGGATWSELHPPVHPEAATFTADGSRLVVADVHHHRPQKPGREPRPETSIFITLADRQPQRWRRVGRLRGELDLLTHQPGAPCGLIAAGRNGVWTSMDCGAHWQTAMRGLTDTPRIEAVAAWNDELLALSRRRRGALLLSRDQGRSWRSWRTGPELDSSSDSLLVDVGEPCRLLLGGAWRIVLSDDCARTWRTVERRIERLVAPPGARAVYGIDRGSGAVSRSTDFGHSWQAVLPLAYGNATVDPDRPEHLFAGGLSTSGKPFLAESFDGGTSWRQMPSPTDLGAITILEAAAGPRTSLYAGSHDVLWRRERHSGRWIPVLGGQGRIRDVLLPASQPHVVYACTAGRLLASEDDGATWTSLCPRSIDCQGLHLADGGKSLLVVNGAYLWRYVSSSPGLRLLYAAGVMAARRALGRT